MKIIFVKCGLRNGVLFKVGFSLNVFVSPFNGICSILLGFAILYSFNYLIMTMILIHDDSDCTIGDRLFVCLFVCLFVWLLHRPSVIPLVDFKFVGKKMNPKVSKRTPPTILSYNFFFRWELCRQMSLSSGTCRT